MPTVLLITDLEGVAGVDELPALVACSPTHRAACELLAAEVDAAVAGFREAGFTDVRVSDSHRAGDGQAHGDAYADELFDGVDAVACLGMHAPADTAGFAAHTITVHCDLLAGTQRLSESDLVLGLAAARGVPAVFVSGDDVLEAHLAGRVPYVLTKTSRSREASTSRPLDDVRADLRAAARGAPVSSPVLPDGPWTMRFKSRWQEALAGSSSIDGATPRERYGRLMDLVARTAGPLGRAVRSFDPARQVEDSVRLLLRSFDRARPEPVGDAARRALAAFLRVTDGEASWQLADRALALHMLEGHAPAFFAAADLRATLEAAVDRAGRLPGELPPGLDPFEAMWRLDGAYVRASRGLAHSRFPELRDYARSIGDQDPTMAWLLWQMATQAGWCEPIAFPERALRRYSRNLDLYWLTHLYLLATRYLRAPLPAGWTSDTEELLLAAPELIATRHLDLAAEVAVCLQLAGEDDSDEHRALLRALADGQEPDGTIHDRTVQRRTPISDSHTTAIALMALARYA
jgi:D-amino peptidase